jgi:bifunctional DNA-binding transcriptional regulator/antitoxin component of YhaV-PrlF toxin-antitoxin module
MELQTAVEIDGSLVLPADVQRELGIPPGASVRVAVESGNVRIIMENRLKLSKAEALDRIRSMQELFADADYSLEDDLIQSRKEEAEHSLRKWGY